MKAPCFDEKGKSAGTISLPDELFGTPHNPTLITQVIEAERANRHQGTHKTKERHEVSGGGRKPWKQKGTGNARQGSTRSPQWRGGGIVFGPRARSYHVRLPKKMRHAGMRSIFASRAKEGALSVIKGFDMQEYSTKKAYGVFKSMSMVPHSTVLFVSAKQSNEMQRSFANIRNIQLMNVQRLQAPELYYAGKLVIAEEALPTLIEHYKDTKKGESVAKKEVVEK